jgi:hypothetical protein
MNLSLGEGNDILKMEMEIEEQRQKDNKVIIENKRLKILIEEIKNLIELQ